MKENVIIDCKKSTILMSDQPISIMFNNKKVNIEIHNGIFIGRNKSFKSKIFLSFYILKKIWSKKKEVEG